MEFKGGYMECCIKDKEFTGVGVIEVYGKFIY